MASKINVDLALPPEERWQLSTSQIEQARNLLDVYMLDLGVDASSLELIESSAIAVVPPAPLAEMHGLAESIGVPVAHVFTGNLYYDALKTIWGCTAFAVETKEGPIHARNLDWGSENRILNDHTLITSFNNAPAGDFITIGWPGFVGVLSAVARGRFAVSLNAGLSEDPAQLATPVVFLLRDVLENAKDFDEAVTRLARTPIASDCLLLVSGPRPSQMVVIERTPTRHALRPPSGAAVFVTNDYLKLEANPSTAKGQLHETSCRRRERIEDLVRSEPPADLQTCIRYLSDPDVRMLITVQQMAFDPRTGEYELNIP